MPNFGETLINTTTAGEQGDPNIYGLIDGGFVIAWQGNGVGDATGLFTQRYNASGAKVGGETLVNTTLGGEQSQPSVVGLLNGGYVVTWSGLNAGGGAVHLYPAVQRQRGQGRWRDCGQYNHGRLARFP
ncbi:UNVERIFIED_ORG: hypothetical protein J2Y76_003280 [Pseudomonas reinekei]|uniref:hypothetical protein n=1 Tax=Pseudomonas laurylsulfatiphila TaxID=2011015 RepID=UPI003D251AC6|nr:hypothetical protein [Pseudomonas reinekei]